MGKPTGFLEYNAQKNGNQPAEERIRHYNEFSIPLKSGELRQQGARCMDCGIPFCHSGFGCPVVNLIPEWNDLVYHDLWREAYERLESTNNFPEITGRICPAPCETACTLSINDSPVTIKQIELAIIERAFKEGWVQPKKPAQESGRQVAIIGSGPAGLAAAQQLRRLGHGVTVFERSPKIGGLLRYGIPDFKLEKWVLDRRLSQMTGEGVVFETDVEAGTDISARYLQRSFDAILIAVGAGRARDLQVPGRELKGIYPAMEYLSQANQFVEGTRSEADLISARDRHVLVIGGGDTGSDCIGTANRQGAKSVTQLEILDRPAEWTEPWNPSWPDWPNILRTSSSQEEGCNRDWAILTKAFGGVRGKVTSARFSRIKWADNIRGTAPAFEEIPGSEFELKVDLVLLAMGFLHLEHNALLDQLGVEFDTAANLKVDDHYRSSVQNVFAAGDAHSGASLVVRAIFHGRQAAQHMHQYLDHDVRDQ